jgi:hypothetical protein
MNLYKKEILKHGLEWRKHKYLYKDANGNYVYPEDVAGKAKSTASNIGSMATAAGTAAKTKISNTIADQKQKHKDRVFTNTTLPEKLTSKKIGRDDNKELDQIASAHKESTGRKDKSNVVLDYIRTPHTGPSIKAKNLDKQKAKTASRKRPYDEKARDASFQAEQERRQATINARNTRDRDSNEYANLVKAERDTAERKNVKVAAKKKVEDQRKSAHAGYEGRIKKRNAILRARSQEIGADIEGKKRREEKLRKEDVYENANYKYDDWYDGGGYVPIAGHHTKRTVGSTGERLPFNAPGMLKAISDTNRRKARKKKVKDQIRSAHRSAR